MTTDIPRKQRVLCIGGGPAGLTAAYLLAGRGLPVTVLEADPALLGGISRTVSHKGFGCDIGGHRFFSKSEEVNAFWQEILGSDLISRSRKSRIYYRRKFFDYPIRPANAFLGLGLVESLRCAFSFLRWQLFPVRNPANFEEWVSNKFGARLFSIFFRSYTEKVWGMKCTEISADWAAQRIKGLSLWTALANALLPRRLRPGGGVIKTLIDSFLYPRKGPGMMWERVGELVRERGGEVLMGRRATGVRRTGSGWEVDSEGDGGRRVHEADTVVSSVPLRELVLGLSPAPPAEVLEAARGLRYRDFLVVGLVARDRGAFDDNWIYIHDPEVKVGRVQNFLSWSPEMVPEPGMACYGMEYFCFEGDGLWSRDDADLVALATREIAELGLARTEDVREGFVVRQPKAYPVYDDGYEERVDVIRRHLDGHCPGLHVAGRNGMHKYNNQDHSMMTAMLVAENVLADANRYDVWKVNQDAEYHETETGDERDRGGRMVPTRAASG